MKFYIKKLFFIFILILLSNTAYSQVNIESIRNKNNKNVAGEIQLGSNIQIGNVKLVALSAATTQFYSINKHHFLIKANYNIGVQDKKKYLDDSFLHLRWTWMFYKLLGVEIFTQVQKNEFTLLNLRQLNGIGIRTELFKNNDHVLSLGTGLMTDYEDILKLNQKTLTLRSTSYISFVQNFSKSNQIAITSYFQPRITDASDYRIQIEGLIRLKLVKNINIYIDNTIVYSYDTQTPESVLSRDFSTKTSITYNW